MLDDTKAKRAKTDETIEIQTENGDVIHIEDVVFSEFDVEVWEHDTAYVQESYAFECGWIGGLKIDRDMFAKVTSYAHVEHFEERKAER